MSTEKYRSGLLVEKSRSDYTLLTVDFNLRSLNSVRTLPSPAGTTPRVSCAVPAGLGGWIRFYNRRLRYASPTVNKVLSLQDILVLTWH